MAKTRQFNKIMAIAPSETLNSEIDYKQCGYLVANLFHGYLNPTSNEHQVIVMPGYEDALGKRALRSMDSPRKIKSILMSEFMIPEHAVVLHGGGIVEIEEDETVVKRNNLPSAQQRFPVFFADAVRKKREMAIITDGMQMELAMRALSDINIVTRGFEVMPPPTYEKPVLAKDSSITPILSMPQRDNEAFDLPKALAGDS